MVQAGEIVGVAAVEGNGQRELLRAVAGRAHVLRGKIEVMSPVGFIPEDRTTEGLIPELSLVENVVLGAGEGEAWIRRGRIDWRAAREYTKGLLTEYGVAASGPDAPAASLSGGNQQKVVAARELAPDPRSSWPKTRPAASTSELPRPSTAGFDRPRRRVRRFSFIRVTSTRYSSSPIAW